MSRLILNESPSKSFLRVQYSAVNDPEEDAISLGEGNLLFPAVDDAENILGFNHMCQKLENLHSKYMSSSLESNSVMFVSSKCFLNFLVALNKTLPFSFAKRTRETLLGHLYKLSLVPNNRFDLPLLLESWLTVDGKNSELFLPIIVENYLQKADSSETLFVLIGSILGEVKWDFLSRYFLKTYDWKLELTSNNLLHDYFLINALAGIWAEEGEDGDSTNSQLSAFCSLTDFWLSLDSTSAVEMYFVTHKAISNFLQTRFRLFLNSGSASSEVTRFLPQLWTVLLNHEDFNSPAITLNRKLLAARFIESILQLFDPSLNGSDFPDCFSQFIRMDIVACTNEGFSHDFLIVNEDGTLNSRAYESIVFALASFNILLASVEIASASGAERDSLFSRFSDSDLELILMKIITFAELEVQNKAKDKKDYLFSYHNKFMKLDAAASDSGGPLQYFDSYVNEKWIALEYQPVSVQDLAASLVMKSIITIPSSFRNFWANLKLRSEKEAILRFISLNARSSILAKEAKLLDLSRERNSRSFQ